MNVKKFLKGFVYAGKGVAYAFSTQLNFKFHTIAATLILISGYLFELDRSEWLWVVAAVLLVMVAELFNTAIEVLVDLVSPGYHPKAGIIKDLSSAAVLLVAILAGLIAALIFVPKFLEYAS